MKINKTQIKEKIEKMKVIRGFDPFLLKTNDINYIVDAMFDKIKFEVMSQNARQYEKTWMSYKTMVNEKKCVFKPMKKIELSINNILKNLKKDLDIAVRHSFNKGPVYSWRTDNKNHFTKDWISIPKPSRFTNIKLYYKTLLHEMGHASCSRPRLCLKFRSLDEEEISVEANALIICFLLGLNVWDDCISYMTNWNVGSSQDTIVIKNNRDWKSVKQKVKRITRYMLIG